MKGGLEWESDYLRSGLGSGEKNGAARAPTDTRTRQLTGEEKRVGRSKGDETDQGGGS